MVGARSEARGYRKLNYDRTLKIAGPIWQVAVRVRAQAGDATADHRDGRPVALAGAGLAVFGGLGQTGVFAAAVLPVAGPAWWARTAVLVALGAGLGLVVTGALRLRKLSAAPAMVDA